MAASVIRLAISNTYMNRKITWKKKTKNTKASKKGLEAKTRFYRYLVFS